MQYNGGKAAVAKTLAAILSKASRGKRYWEPFVGAANVIQHVRAASRLGTDADVNIIGFLRSVQLGWVPPQHVSEELYQHVREKLVGTGHPLAAFVGYGCSFGGKFFGGYARSPGRNYALNAYRSVLKQRPLIKGVRFRVADYQAVDLSEVDVIYADPPYAGTTECGAGQAFDSASFWDWVHHASQRVPVFVSEFQAPAWARPVWQRMLKDGLRRWGGAHTMTERLFLAGSL